MGLFFLKYCVSNAEIPSVSLQTPMVCVIDPAAVHILKAVLQELSVLFFGCSVLYFNAVKHPSTPSLAFPFHEGKLPHDSKTKTRSVWWFSLVHEPVSKWKQPGVWLWFTLWLTTEYRPEESFSWSCSPLSPSLPMCVSVYVCICWGSRSLYQWPARSSSWWCMEEWELQ